MGELIPEPRPFLAAPWARGPHAQTLLARTFRPRPVTPWTRERLETPDGDFLDLDWGAETDPGAPIVLLLHGLEGSAGRRYVQNAGYQLAGRGVRPVGLNFRGCSGELNRLPRFYHSGDSPDPRHVLDVLRARYPGRPIGAMGFSLGGNMLLKLLGEDGGAGEARVDAAVAMSVPYDLAAGSRLLERSRMGRFYSWYFLRSLRGKVQAKAERLDGIDIDRALAVRTIWEFDDVVTAPLHGFADAAAYYAASSSYGFLHAIRTPTLLLHATDDPFLPADRIPVAPAAENPYLRLALHPLGGHVGFLEGTPRNPRFWGEEEAARFLAERLTAARTE